MNFFLSPRFGELCAVTGAAIAYFAARVATRQKARTDLNQRRRAEVDRAWDRLVWVMDHLTEFTPGLIANLLAQTITIAERLNDNNLVDMAGQVAAEPLAAGDPHPRDRYIENTTHNSGQSTRRPGRDVTAMSAPTKARNLFDGLTREQHDDAMRKLAEVVDQAKTVLGAPPPPELAKQYLAPTARERARSRD